MKYLVIGSILVQAVCCWLDPAATEFTRFLLWDLPIHLITGV